MKNARPVRPRGLTLVELMVVVALLGILTALVASAIGPLATRYRVRQGTEAAAHALAQAQSQARATGRCHRVEAFDLGVAVPSGTPGTALVLASLPTANCETGAGWVAVQTYALPSGVTAMIDSAVGPNPILRPNGRSRDPVGALVRINPMAADARVVLSASGAICVTDTGLCP